MPSISWEDSSGHYVAESDEGRILGDELDRIFSAEKPEEYIARRYPNEPIEPRQWEEPTKVRAIGICLGGFTVSLAAGYYIYARLLESLRGLHS